MGNIQLFLSVGQRFYMEVIIIGRKFIEHSTRLFCTLVETMGFHDSTKIFFGRRHKTKTRILEEFCYFENFKF
jgi:hypothetical protein